MIPQSQVRKPKNSSKVNLVISAVFHGVLLFVLLYFAAREGMLGNNIRKIAVEMVKKEKEPEKPKAPEKKEEAPKIETPKVAVTPKMEAQAPPSSGQMAPAVAPPVVDAGSFDFDGGKTVVSSSDPVQIYKNAVENSLYSRWNRPDDMDDHALVAEVEVSIDRTGRVSDPVWKKNSGDKRWDNSVSEAIAQTASIGSTPPANFPPRVVVRFDVVPSEAVVP